ncbi:sensor histidine kinase [Phenylobacterium deserti]|uniref:histidine kinase n=1 Tax=Phenylobacterium deserti TaxID=1914756 RepID=A0A328ADH2_9CAUL|nr:PAS domain-containing protein [Phenylobacterium deserti]RAK52690.1 histidine kinase [Phenylobacterium deserti]
MADADLEFSQRRTARLNEEMARVLADNVNEAVCFLDEHYRVVFMNREALRLDGRPPEELIGKSHWEAFPASVGTVVEANYRRAMDGEALEFEHRYRSDLHDIWLCIRAVPTSCGLALFYRDIGEDRRSAERFAEVNRSLNAVLDNASVAIFLMDEHQHCSYMNAAAERLTGYTLAETRGRPLHDVVHHTRPDGSPYPLEECPIDRAFPENNHQQGEEIFVHKDGNFYTVAFTASPIRDESAKSIGTIIEVRNITAEKAALAARELLMREVDHRARNALTVVQSILRLTRAPDLQTFKDVVAGRVDALARSQGMLAAEKWEGASLRGLVSQELAALVPPARYVLDGPDVMVAAIQAQPVAMIVHELVTNAIKYGALHEEEGQVLVTWSAGATLRLEWKEVGGPAVDAPPERQGFGARLVSQLAEQLRGKAEYDWKPEGLTVRLEFSAT